jgi:hypothetical protein
MKIQVGPISGRSYFWPVLFLAGLISGRSYFWQGWGAQKTPSPACIFSSQQARSQSPPYFKINRLFQ